MTWTVVPGGLTGPQQPKPSPLAQRSAPPAGKRGRVLVVDDEAAICKALVMALQQEGFEAMSVLSGDAAIEVVRDVHIDVMLIDLRLEHTRGDVAFEFIAALKPHLRYQTLFMTGDITERAERLIAACKCHYLQKPFDLRDMLDAVNAIAPRIAADSAG